MKKKTSAKQILAIIAIVILVGLYLSTLVFALMSSPIADTLLKISLLSTLGVPIVPYLLLMFFRLTKRESKPEDKVYANEEDDPYTEDDFKNS